MEYPTVDPDKLFDLTGKTIVITGAVGLLGRQHAETVARAGGTPVLLDIQEEEAQALATELAARHAVGASGWRVDITSESDVEANCAAVLARHGCIDGLINNAANNPKVEGNTPQHFSRLERFSLDAWNADLAVGLTGAFLCAKHYGMAIASTPGGEGGSIVNISSDLGLVAPDQRLYARPGLPPDQQPVKPVTYSVVKTGLIGLTRYLATYWADQGVRCNALCPGGVENGQDPTFLTEVSARIPLGRLAQPDEYHGVLLFLLSSASSYVTGSILVADGGRTCW
jgi:NAD(P)-dependent dehydrogenase (short-subunit alcohol dehydrogenase family)